MDTPNTTAAYIVHPSFDNPVPLNHRDPVHALINELCFEGQLPEFKIVLGPQVELPKN
jgi:hypothetical protein